MLLNFRGRRLNLLLVLVLLSFSACKQSEFYEKQGLSEISEGGNGGTNTEPPIVIINNPPVIVDPPVVVNPPVVIIGDPPVVVVPPVIVDPPIIVVDPPVIVPPVVVVTPPVITPPVVIPPVVVVDPPVIVPPVINPGVILNDRSEIFTQDSSKNGDVDILWVIDDSGSMADEQDSLGRNFTSFINQFLTKNIDFKMAITTTDGTSSRNGKMVGDSTKLTSAAAKANKATFISDFTKWVKVGTKGSGIEQGLKTAASFTDRYASSFLRQDAYLVVVYLSDEEDQSEKKVSEYLTKLQALKKNKGMAKAYSIIAMAKKGGQWETVGKRYAEIAAATAGTTSDIKQDFSATLLDMGGKIVNLVDRFALNEAPFENKIEVFVNQVKVQAGYTFDSTQRTVKFNEGSIPAEGSKVEVRYKVKATVLGAI